MNTSAITPLTIYLWQLADKIATSLQTVSGFILAFAVICIVVSTFPELDEEVANRSRKKGSRAFLISMALFLSATLIPSSNTVAMMVIVPRIAESKVLQQDVPDIYNAAVQAVKDALKK